MNKGLGNCKTPDRTPKNMEGDELKPVEAAHCQGFEGYCTKMLDIAPTMIKPIVEGFHDKFLETLQE